MRALRFLVLASLFGISSAAQSSLTSRDWTASGDGLLTFDDQTGYEWLDLTHTTGMSYVQVLGQLGAAGSFAGFQVASTAQVQALFQSGGWTGGWNTVFPNDPGHYEEATSIIQLLGNTYGTLFPGDTISAGFVANASATHNEAAYLHTRNNLDFPFRSATGISIFPIDVGIEGAGTYLYRDIAAPIPEPETYALMLAGLGLLGVAARRRRANEAKARPA